MGSDVDGDDDIALAEDAVVAEGKTALSALMGVRLGVASNGPSGSAEQRCADAKVMDVSVERADTEMGVQNVAAVAASKVLEERAASAAAASPSHRTGSCAWERIGNRCPARRNLEHPAGASVQPIVVVHCEHRKVAAIRLVRCRCVASDWRSRRNRRLETAVHYRQSTSESRSPVMAEVCPSCPSIEVAVHLTEVASIEGSEHVQDDMLVAQRIALTHESEG